MTAEQGSVRPASCLIRGSVPVTKLEELLTETEQEPSTSTRRKNAKPVSDAHHHRHDIIERAKAWLEKADPAIQGDDGSGTAFRTVERVVNGFVLTDEQAFEVLREWNQQCVPPWPDDLLLRKIQEGRKKGDTPEGELRDAPPTKTNGAASGASSWSTNPRPTIHISTELHHNVDKSVEALKSDPHLYQRDGKLVHVTRVTREQSEKSPSVATDEGVQRHALVEGSPQIVETSIPTLRERLTRYAIFKKWNERDRDYKATLPTDPIVTATHARGEWPVRTIVGITETPTLRPDGSVVQDAGYDAATGYLYQPSEPFPRVPDKPSQLDAAKALLELIEIFVNFPYVKHKEDAHRMVPVAAILTLIARPAIQGATPAFVFDASTRGSGKTLQTDAIAMVVSGRTMPRMNYPAQEEELEKVLGAYALRGAQFFSLDNVTRPFGGGALDRVITARDTVDLRVLGRSEIPTLSWRAVILATGNNMSIYQDTSRRILLARLEPDDEHPEKRRDFKHEDLPAWAKKERARLVVAALTILRGYFVAGRPEQEIDRWGSFEEWSRLIPHALVWAGGANPMLARPSSDVEVDTELSLMRLVLKQIYLRMGIESFRTSEIINGLFHAPREYQNGQLVKDNWEDLREALTELCDPKPGKSPDAKTLGKRFARHRGRVIDGLKLLVSPGGGGIMTWKVVKVGERRVDEESSTWNQG